MTERSPHASFALFLCASTALALAPQPALAQSPDAPKMPTPAAWRFVGPYRAGWATVAAGIPDQPNTYYFGGAGGGVWKTTDAGRTWQGLMQHQASSAIGALAIAPSNPKILYVGTGQVAARYDIMAGDGVYRSDDGGETWKNVGLNATRHIGAILIDPKDPQKVLVAALGHVFGPNPERGVYLTTDGGAHWQHVLALGDTVGAVDLAWDPEHPSVVYAGRCACTRGWTTSSRRRARGRASTSPRTRASTGRAWPAGCRRAWWAASGWPWRGAARGASYTRPSPSRARCPTCRGRPARRGSTARTTAARHGRRPATTRRWAAAISAA
ncbi:MAG: hypothetical protein P8Z36_11800 [Gemmatimonadota bacterium]